MKIIYIFGIEKENLSNKVKNKRHASPWTIKTFFLLPESFLNKEYNA